MGDNSAIEWTDATWNPIVGCSIVSPGCTNCYAMKMAARLQKMNRTGGSGTNYVNHYDGTTKRVNGKPVWTGKIAIAADHLFYAPLSWRKPKRIFVNSMGDLFHEDVPDEMIDKVFAVMALAPRHTFQVLTKRAKRMREYMNDRWQPAAAQKLHLGKFSTLDIPAETQGEGRRSQIERACEPILERLGLVDTEDDDLWTEEGSCKAMQWEWPLHNVWLGVSTEDQTRADERVPDLLATPSAVRFVSYEPAVGPIRFKATLGEDWLASGLSGERRGLDWIICGGESGPGARPMSIQWAREVRDQCAAAQVAFFFKQWGEWRPAGFHRSETPGRFAFGDYEHDRTAMIQTDCYPRQFTKFGARSVMERVGKHAAGRLLDGVEHNAMPEARHG